MNSDFQAPPARWSVLAAVGGVVTAIAAIAGLEYCSHHLARQALGQNLQLSASSIQTPIYRSPATIEAERLLERKVDWEAAACNFNQKLIPNTDMTFVYLDVGTHDQKFLNSTEQFHHTLLQLGIPHAFYVFPGGHGVTGADSGWHYWHKHIADSLTYVGQQWKSLQM